MRLRILGNFSTIGGQVMQIVKALWIWVLFTLIAGTSALWLPFLVPFIGKQSLLEKGELFIVAAVVVGDALGRLVEWITRPKNSVTTGWAIVLSVNVLFLLPTAYAYGGASAAAVSKSNVVVRSWELFASSLIAAGFAVYRTRY